MTEPDASAPTKEDSPEDTAAPKRKARHARRMDRGMLIGIAIIVIGACILFYPLVMQLINQHQENQVVETYNEQVDSLSNDAKQQMLEAAHEYNERLYETGVTAYPLGSTNSDLDQEYQGQLGYAGMMSTISIPAISLNLPIYHGTTDAALEAGAGHLYGTSLPVGGANTHAVIAAHRGIPTALMFTRLGEVKIGDTFYITVLGERLAYRVDQIKVVEPDDTSLFTIEPGKDYVSLLTCTPYGQNTQRLVVRGVRIPDSEVPATLDPDVGLYPVGYFAVLSLIVVACVIAAVKIRNKRKVARRKH